MNDPQRQTSRHRRDRNSSWWVRVSDRVAKQVITIGGIGTILVVMLVVLVLLGNVLPLFQGNSVSVLTTVPLTNVDQPADAKVVSASTLDAATPVACGVDEYFELLWILHRGDYVTVRSIASGQLLSTHAASNESVPKPSGEIECCSVADNDSSMLAGYADGSIRPITLAIQVEFISEADVPMEIASSLHSGAASHDGVLYRSMSSGLVRKQLISEVVFHPRISVFDAPVRCVDWRNPQAASSFDESQAWTWGATDGHSIAMGVIDNKVNGFSGSITQETKTWSHVPELTDHSAAVIGLMVGSRSEQIQSLDAKGRVVVWSPSGESELIAGLIHTSLAGTESKAIVSVPLLGRSTLMIGSESGHIESVAATATPKGQELLSIHRFAGQDGPIADLAASPESRIVAAQFQSGKGAVYYVPTNRQLVSWQSQPVQGASFHPRVFFAANAACVGLLTETQVDLWRLNVPFPEASLSSFFSRIWYEGYGSPQHIWQSSTGTVEGEYKFGFWPLIFGTLKATFFSMLIGAPIALMAAIFGSEFMSSRWRARVKPVIELMASVPSVVLGFIGALVLAPILRDNLMAVLLSVVAVLFFFLLSSNLWLIIPSTVAIRLRHLRLPILFVLIPLGVLIATQLADSVESILFNGNLIQWLSSHDGSGWSGWFCLALFPVSLLVAWFFSGPLNPYVQRVARRMSPLRFSIVHLGLFGCATLATLMISAIAAGCLSTFGMDPRGSVLGAYQERNALLVGGILGFAIIPLIYTISEDALQSVPQHLRSASLGCGATVWQTTIRVVIPTAMSGLFSAMMIGFGRAVGETMVVLMAAGNTPVMDVNPMNGYRTLSATLATELPEAARGSTHFHALFLAAFLLFCFTLVANTVAEIVRLRFRKRAYQL